MALLILAAAVGAAASGTAFYAYYDHRLATSERRTAEYLSGFDERFRRANDTIAFEREQAKAEVRRELEPLQRFAAAGETLAGLVARAAPAVWFVTSLDEAGQPSVGSAFAVASDPGQALLVTSYTAVRAATVAGGPEVTVVRGTERLPATLWTWQEERDLALLVVARGDAPTLAFAPPEPPVRVGDRIFAVSGLGGTGASVTQGFVGDVSAAGVQHDAAVGPAFQGGPLLNSAGEVVGVASRAYAPLGFASDGPFFAVPVQAVCERVLKCPAGAVAGPGPRAEPTPAPPPTTTS